MIDCVKGQPIKQAQVPREINLCYDSLDRLAEIVTNLTNRVDCVMAPDQPCDEEVNKDVEFCSIANDIRVIRNRINNEADRIENILSRLEL